MNGLAEKYAKIVKTQAKSLGFDFCGIARAGFLEDEAPKLEAWLNKNFHGQMSYMANHFDKRLDPTKLVEGAKSVISLIYNYYPGQRLPDGAEDFKIAKYAYGQDYHYVIKDRLKTLMENLRKEIGEFGGRVFVDSAPLMERQWAQKSGLGWLGKNSLLLNRDMGSFFFLSELIVDVEINPDPPMVKDYCGTCTRCIDACPTDAIVADGVVDASKCISYLTIELKENIPVAFKGKMENWIFGCDICQDVCPWNRFSKPHREPLFEPKPDLAHMGNREWLEISEEVFQKVFAKSPLKRSKWAGVKRNVVFVNDKQ